MVDLPNTMVDLPNTMVDIPNTMVEIPNTIIDHPNTMVDLPEMSSDSCESLDHRDPPMFLSTSLDIKTVISKVSIPVLISRLKIW